eukprot:s1382_g8.t2
MEETAKRARMAAQSLAGASEAIRNQALEAFKKHLLAQRVQIEEANAQDKADAEAAVKAGKLSSALYKRLDVSGSKFDTLLKGIDEIITLTDPIGQVTYANQVSEGLDLYRLTCPIGVLLIIFEARPDAAVQIASLALKSGNALLLKGGKEAQRSNAALVAAMAAALKDVGLPTDCIQGVDTRTEVSELLKQDKYIDLVIPRGSNELVRSIKDASRIPVLGHADGICAVYVHATWRKTATCLPDGAIAVSGLTQKVMTKGTALGNRFVFPAPDPSYTAQSYKRHLCWIPWNSIISPDRVRYGLLHHLEASEAAVCEVSLTAFRFLVDIIGVRYSQVILFGRSLGNLS